MCARCEGDKSIYNTNYLPHVSYWTAIGSVEQFGAPPLHIMEPTSSITSEMIHEHSHTIVPMSAGSIPTPLNTNDMADSSMHINPDADIDVYEEDDMDEEYQDIEADGTDSSGDEDVDSDEDNTDDGYDEIVPIHRIYDGVRQQTESFTVDHVTPEMIASGAMDMQGISWHLTFHTRQEVRQERLQQYIRYANLGVDRSKLIQLRHLLAATSKNDIYYSNSQNIMHWCPTSRLSSEVISLSGSFSHVSVTTMAAKSDMLIVGGFMGEYIFKCVDGKQGGVHTGLITTNPNGITNHMHIQQSRSGMHQCVISSNDQHVRTLDLSRLEIQSVFDFPWAANCSSTSPDKRLLCIVGDDPKGVIISADSGEELCKLSGHLDYSFSCAWSPCGLYIATGNQDCTTRIYDVRRSDKTLAVLDTELSAVRSLQFSNDGKCLVIAESADFVHIVDMTTLGRSEKLGDGSRTRAASVQTIEFFGEIAGVALAGHHSDRLFIGNEDPRIGGIMEYERYSPHFRPDTHWNDVAATVL
ncbi:hypothetical protein BASA50_005623 [Batrachochytrium salamandrivorans]|uniref:DUF2415 domain-containing protein n=1 Tax=Batrachochytrium salamandrivorans TaxID=1357716 RepID=A0ABQ8FF19_9FUNG|nr:hypothetical protein BASA50_005623 [Batrachochytrium salamandrivorans]